MQVLDSIESWLDAERDQLALWLPIALGSGIAAWFILPIKEQWIAFLLGMIGLGLAGLLLPLGTRLGRAVMWFGFLAALGCALIWWRSSGGADVRLTAPKVVSFTGRIERVELMPARDTVRITALPDPGRGLPRRVRLNLPDERVQPGLAPGAQIRLRARLLPPAPASLPGGYDFVRVAWFMGVGATGRVLDPIEILQRPQPNGFSDHMAAWRTALTSHILQSAPGSSGGVAAAFVTGDVGGISDEDQAAMRKSGLAHLLSISGLHVAVVIGGTMVIVLRLLALSPTLALRWPLPVIAAGAGAVTGIAYTILSGAEVPTLRSCIAALIVLGAMAVGREAMTLRMVATAAFVLLLWHPDALIGPSFQLSFAAVVALVAFHEHPHMRSLFQKREEGLVARVAREGASLLLTGLVVEFALTPIALFHFQRTGLFGALANMIAIPLTSFVIMPLEALALFGDMLGLGVPFWWLTNRSIALLLSLANHVAAWPGAVIPIPSMPMGAFALLAFGGIWIALWRTKWRWLGVGPFLAGLIWTLLTPAPDLLISGDGRHLALRTKGHLQLLRPRAGDYTRSTFQEAAGELDDPGDLESIPEARCSADLCVADAVVGDRTWRILATRSPYRIDWEAFRAACAEADIVVSDRRLPRGCAPRWLKADRSLLAHTGGLAIRFSSGSVRTVRLPADDHPWIGPINSNRPVRVRTDKIVDNRITRAAAPES